MLSAAEKLEDRGTGSRGTFLSPGPPIEHFGKAMILFWLILLAGTVTMVVMVIEVVRRPVRSSLAVAVVAVSAVTAALHQVSAARVNALSLPLTFVLVWLLAFRARRAGWERGSFRPSTRDGRG